MLLSKGPFYGLGILLIVAQAVGADLAKPADILKSPWSVSFEAPIFTENDVKTLFAKVESAMDALGEVQEDIIDRFSKCDGDIAALQAQGKVLESMSVPYHVAKGQIKLVMEKARLLRRKLKDAKPEDLDHIGSLYLPFVRQFYFVIPLIREVAQNSAKGYLVRVEGVYRSLAEFGVNWNDFATEAEKEETLTWQLLLKDLKSMQVQGVALLEGFSASDRPKVKRDYFAALDVLNSAIYGGKFKSEADRRKFILVATKAYATRFSSLYESLSWQSEQLLGADREYDLLVLSMGTNELLKRYVKDLSRR